MRQMHSQNIRTRNTLRTCVAFLTLLSKVTTLHCKAFQAKICAAFHSPYSNALITNKFRPTCVGIVQGLKIGDRCCASTQNMPLPASQRHRLHGHGIANRLKFQYQGFYYIFWKTCTYSDTSPILRFWAAVHTSKLFSDRSCYNRSSGVIYQI